MNVFEKRTTVHCNEKLIDIWTESLVGSGMKDPLGEEFYLNLDSDLHSIGNAVLQALSKSRDLSISDEDRECYTNMIDEEGIEVADKWFDERYPEWKLFDDSNEALLENNEKWWSVIEKLYSGRNRESIFKKLQKNMQNVSVYSNDISIRFVSSTHDHLSGWTYGDKKDPALEFSISASSSVEVVGAAAKYAIGNCRGKGADLIRGLLFPKGQPETFEEYLKELGL